MGTWAFYELGHAERWERLREKAERIMRPAVLNEQPVGIVRTLTGGGNSENKHEERVDLATAVLWMLEEEETKS